MLGRVDMPLKCYSRNFHLVILFVSERFHRYVREYFVLAFDTVKSLYGLEVPIWSRCASERHTASCDGCFLKVHVCFIIERLVRCSDKGIYYLGTLFNFVFPTHLQNRTKSPVLPGWEPITWIRYRITIFSAGTLVWSSPCQTTP